MKLPTHYLENLSPARYREYIKLLPRIQQENTKAITMLIFTFIALSILSIFAINPTLSTIFDLQKQLEENIFVDQQLQIKINNLSTLQTQYQTLSDRLNPLYDAIPQTPLVPIITDQLQLLAEQSGITITSLTLSPAVISDPKQPEGVKTHSSFSFTLEAEGDYTSMLTFAERITNFNRIVTIESITFIKNEETGQLILRMIGRQYFKK